MGLSLWNVCGPRCCLPCPACLWPLGAPWGQFAGLSTGSPGTITCWVPVCSGKVVSGGSLGSVGRWRALTWPDLVPVCASWTRCGSAGPGCVLSFGRMHCAVAAWWGPRLKSLLSGAACQGLLVPQSSLPAGPWMAPRWLPLTALLALGSPLAGMCPFLFPVRLWQCHLRGLSGLLFVSAVFGVFFLAAVFLGGSVCVSFSFIFLLLLLLLQSWGAAPLSYVLLRLLITYLETGPQLPASASWVAGAPLRRPFTFLLCGSGV